MQELRYFPGQHHLQSCDSYTEECQEAIINDFIDHCVNELKPEFNDIHDMLLDLYDEHWQEISLNMSLFQILQETHECFKNYGDDIKAWFTHAYDAQSFSVINENVVLEKMKCVIEKVDEQLTINEQ